ncbi:cytochrome c oxidase subunit 3 [Neolewinella agarilytica]|uniref:Cytochrome c oxidase subunit 3 n=1 Tax=Neolewinella agarilytica TaxID=478744 RepID=A0A1H8ZVB3_9BACT|nr:cytochrome c oxidase subunit 3 [Neolewinella agarilytica]SEP68223.1 cytochrome c oxidase subunit 3 [Neolewinella agarilytica]
METTIKTEMEVATRRNKVHPKKMALWVALVSLAMMFTALTSAYIVRRSAGNWLEFSIPTIFYWNTLVIVASSLTLHAALGAFKREAEGAYKTLISASFGLGIAFVVMQYAGWQQLAAEGVPLTINPSGDFVYAISGLHALHVIGGIAALAVALVMAFIRKLRRTPARQLRLELTVTYWHFIGALWIYLILFLSLQR